MPTAGGASLREKAGVANARLAPLSSEGTVSGQVGAVFDVPFTLLDIPVAVLPDGTTRKTGRNSGARRRRRTGTGPRGGRTAAEAKVAPPEGQPSEDRRHRDGRGRRLRRRRRRPVRGIDLAGRERRVRFDIALEIVERRVEAGTKVCPRCGNRTSGRFPDGMPGPLQHGADLHAFTVELPVERMLSQRRAIGAVRAVLASGSWKPPAWPCPAPSRCAPAVAGSRRRTPAGIDGFTSSPTNGRP